MTISGMYARAKAVAGNARTGLAGRERHGRTPGRALLGMAFFAALVAASCGKSTPPIISVQISPSASQSVDQGQSLNVTVTLGNDVGGAGVTWALTGTGCSGSSCGTLSNPTKTAVIYVAPTGLTTALTVTLTATSVTDPIASSSLTINVPLALAFGSSCPVPAGTAPQALANGSNGVAYNQLIAACGGVAPLTFALNSGTVPVGLNLNSTGTITGTPSGSGTSNFSVTVTDSGSPALTATQAFSITITPPPPLKITSTSLPSAYTGEPYSAKIGSTGGVPPLTWSIAGGSGTLPPGLNLSADGGSISGTATAAGTFSFTVQVQDRALPTSQVQTQALSIVVTTPPPLAITTTSLPSGTVAAGYSAGLQATGGIGPYTWTMKTGLLPAGLSLQGAAIAGTPRLIVPSASFTVQVSDSEPVPQVQTQVLSISIAAGSASSNTLLNGAYAFLFNGFDANGSVVIAGTMTCDGQGNITSGVESSNRIVSGAPEPLPQISINGMYLMNSGPNADGRGTMEIVATSPLSGATLTTDYQLAMDSGGNVHFVENDSTGTRGNGILKPMVGNTFSAGSFSGNYSFEFTGLDSNGKRAVLAGMLNANGSETLSSGGQGPNADFNDAGTFDAGGGPLIVAGAFQLIGASSGAVSLTVPLKPVDTWSFVFYFVSPSDLFFVSVGRPRNLAQSPAPPRLSGEMVLQQPSTAFTASSIKGTSVVSGAGTSGSNASAFAGLLSASACDGTAPVTLTYDQNEAGAFTSGVAAPAAVCSLGTNGRVAFTAPGGGALQSRVAAAYLTAPGQGFLIGNDADATGGLLEQQTADFGSFADPSFQGGYTLSAAAPPESQVTFLTGEVSASAGGGSPTFTGTVDEINPAATIGLAAPYSIAANGRGTLTSNAGGFPSGVFYVTGPGNLRLIPSDPGAHPEVIFFDH